MGEALIALDAMEIRRRGASVLGPLSLAVARGEFVGVVGPNGAGKTTLLRALAGIEQPAAGSVTAFGLPGGTRRFRAAARRRIGVLFQHHDFLPDLPFTLDDVVLFGRAGARGLGRRLGADDLDAAERALEAMDLAPLRRRLYRELSGGERQKAHLARLVAQEADIVLLDEPSAGLDLPWQERLTALVERVFDGGRRCMVMVTHEIGHLPRCCTRAILLKDGHALFDGPPDQAFSRSRLSDLYGCAMEVVPRSGRWHAFSGEGTNACC